MNYSEAVQQLRTQPSYERLLRDAYLDADPLAACDRFYESDEFRATRQILRLRRPARKRILDVGAGNGIAAHAFARLGARVTAVEPGGSSEVGAGAIRQVGDRTGVRINVIRALGEQLPLASSSHDIAYARQVLHHAHDLPGFVVEVARTLAPGGLFLAAREHVVDDDEQLRVFLDSHPLHRLHGGEHAYRLEEYLRAFGSAGLRIKSVLNPWSSVVNYWPRRPSEIAVRQRQALVRRYGILGHLLTFVPLVVHRLEAAWARADARPGRLYSFLAVKPI